MILDLIVVLKKGEDPEPEEIILVPDPRCPKCYGSFGSGTLIFTHINIQPTYEIKGQYFFSAVLGTFFVARNYRIASNSDRVGLSLAPKSLASLTQGIIDTKNSHHAQSLRLCTVIKTIMYIKKSSTSNFIIMTAMTDITVIQKNHGNHYGLLAHHRVGSGAG
jgi:hypothetical protein